MCEYKKSVYIAIYCSNTVTTKDIAKAKMEFSTALEALRIVISSSSGESTLVTFSDSVIGCSACEICVVSLSHGVGSAMGAAEGVSTGVW
jgi:hypothetical protein